MTPLDGMASRMFKLEKYVKNDGAISVQFSSCYRPRSLQPKNIPRVTLTWRTFDRLLDKHDRDRPDGKLSSQVVVCQFYDYFINLHDKEMCLQIVSRCGILTCYSVTWGSAYYIYNINCGCKKRPNSNNNHNHNPNPSKTNPKLNNVRMCSFQRAYPPSSRSRLTPK